MLGFTHLEEQVIQAICDAHSDSAAPLRALIATAVVTERDNTGHGFYTTFEVDRSLPALNLPRLGGPVARMRDMGEGMQMGFILWFGGGFPDCLEGFQYCDDSGNTADLKQRSLETLGFYRLEWDDAGGKPMTT